LTKEQRLSGRCVLLQVSILTGGRYRGPLGSNTPHHIISSNSIFVFFHQRANAQLERDLLEATFELEDAKATIVLFEGRLEQGGLQSSEKTVEEQLPLSA
jgi:hypothetical protein